MSDPFQGPRLRRLSGSSWRSGSLPSDLLPGTQPSEKKEMMDGIFCLNFFPSRLSVWIIAAASLKNQSGIQCNEVVTRRSREAHLLIY